MKLVAALTVALVTSSLPAAQQARQSPASAVGVQSRNSDKHWIEVSNGYTRQLLDIGLKHGPEGGSQQGIAQFDTLISNPSLADQHEQRAETEAELAKIRTAMVTEKDSANLNLLKTDFTGSSRITSELPVIREYLEPCPPVMVAAR